MCIVCGRNNQSFTERGTSLFTSRLFKLRDVSPDDFLQKSRKLRKRLEETGKSLVPQEIAY